MLETSKEGPDLYRAQGRAAILRVIDGLEKEMDALLDQYREDRKREQEQKELEEQRSKEI